MSLRSEFSYQGDGGAGAPPFFHGEGGAGAPPFFQGLGGAGAPPFFHGDGGAGAPPFFATITPLPLPAAAVFRPIAPTRITIAARNVSFLDIVPPRNTDFPEVMYLFGHQCQAVRRADLYFLSQAFSPCPRQAGTGGFSRHGNGRRWECVSQQYSSTKTSKLLLGYEVHRSYPADARVEEGLTESGGSS